MRTARRPFGVPAMVLTSFLNSYRVVRVPPARPAALRFLCQRLSQPVKFSFGRGSVIQDRSGSSMSRAWRTVSQPFGRLKNLVRPALLVHCSVGGVGPHTGSVVAFVLVLPGHPCSSTNLRIVSSYAMHDGLLVIRGNPGVGRCCVLAHLNLLQQVSPGVRLGYPGSCPACCAASPCAGSSSSSPPWASRSEYRKMC